ncbi:MAG: tetratricopeptide repeat protein [bacterium]|nr:tetratricopeptide repeat protein [bacterium]
MRRRSFLLAALIAVPIPGAAGADGTPPAGAERTNNAFTFAVLGDNQPSSMYARQPKVYGMIIERINELMPDFAVNCGDLVFGYTTPMALKRQLFEFIEFTSALRLPCYYAFGNHDMSSPGAADILSRLFGRLYSSFDHKGSHFILLNTHLTGEKATVDGEQLAWLERELSENADSENVFVFMHRPMFSVIPDWECEFDRPVRDMLHALFRRHGVRAVFAGHQHLCHAENRDGVMYYITGGAGGSLFLDREDSFHHYLLVSVDGSLIDVTVERIKSIGTDVFGAGTPFLYAIPREPVLIPLSGAAGRAGRIAADGHRLASEGRREEARARYEEALKACAERIEERRDDGDAWFLMGDLHALLQRPAEARDCYRRAVGLGAESPVLWNNLGGACLSLRDPDSAISAFKRALEMSPSCSEARLNLAHALTEIEFEHFARSNFEWFDTPLLDEAIRELNTLIAKSLPPWMRAQALNAMGVIYSVIGAADLNSVRTHFEDAIAADPGLAEAHVNLGNIHRESGRTGLAGLSYLKALEFDADCPAAACNLASLLVAEGKTNEAVRMYREILSRDPSNDDALTGLGAAYLHMHRENPSAETYFSVALETWERSLALNPNRPVLRRTVEGMRARAGRGGSPP